MSVNKEPKRSATPPPPYNVAHAGTFSHFPFNIEEGGGSFEFYMKN